MKRINLLIVEANGKKAEKIYKLQKKEFCVVDYRYGNKKFKNGVIISFPKKSRGPMINLANKVGRKFNCKVDSVFWIPLDYDIIYPRKGHEYSINFIEK